MTAVDHHALRIERHRVSAPFSVAWARDDIISLQCQAGLFRNKMSIIDFFMLEKLQI